MIKYQLYQSQLKDSPSYGKWYARVVSNETVDIKGLAEHMAAHNCPLSMGFLKAVLEQAVSCINEILLDGKRVILPNLASFGATIVHKSGAPSADDFSIAKNVEKVKLQAQGVGEFSAANLSQAARLKESTSYTSPRTTTSTGSDTGEEEVTPPTTPENPDNGDGDMGA